MNIDEACEFLKMKKGTMYYHLQNRSIPATKKGKSYIFFKDELIKWAESGRTTEVPLTPEEMNAALSKRAGKNTPTDRSKLLRKK
jgi:excisionase family DNA binding protein